MQLLGYIERYLISAFPRAFVKNTGVDSEHVLINIELYREGGFYGQSGAREMLTTLLSSYRLE